MYIFLVCLSAWADKSGKNCYSENVSVNCAQHTAGGPYPRETQLSCRTLHNWEGRLSKKKYQGKSYRFNTCPVYHWSEFVYLCVISAHIKILKCVINKFPLLIRVTQLHLPLISTFVWVCLCSCSVWHVRLRGAINGRIHHSPTWTLCWSLFI